MGLIEGSPSAGAPTMSKAESKNCCILVGSWIRKITGMSVIKLIAKMILIFKLKYAI